LCLCNRISIDFDIFAIFTNKGGVIMNLFRRRVVAITLCFMLEIFYISINIPYWVFEGGLLCVEN